MVMVSHFVDLVVTPSGVSHGRKIDFLQVEVAEPRRFGIISTCDGGVFVEASLFQKATKGIFVEFDNGWDFQFMVELSVGYKPGSRGDQS